MPQYKLCVCDFIVIFVGDKYQLYLLAMAEDEEESIDSVVFFVVATRCVHVPRHQHYFFSRPTSSGKCNCSRTGRLWRFASSGRQGEQHRIFNSGELLALAGRRTKWYRSTRYSMDRLLSLDHSVERVGRNINSLPKNERFKCWVQSIYSLRMQRKWTKVRVDGPINCKTCFHRILSARGVVLLY